MEKSRIRIFESISLLSKLMPYYGSSHIGYLLLSSLSKSIRCYLLEHYSKYRRFMLKYAKKVEYVEDEHLEMKLPLDLFKFTALNVRSEKDAELLVELFRTLFKLNYFSRKSFINLILYSRKQGRTVLWWTLHERSNMIWEDICWTWIYRESKPIIISSSK